MGKFGHLLCTVATPLLLKHFTFNRERGKKKGNALKFPQTLKLLKFYSSKFFL